MSRKSCLSPALQGGTERFCATTSLSLFDGGPWSGQASYCVKTNRPQQIEENHQKQDFQTLAERPHTAGGVLLIDDLRWGSSDGGGFIHDHEVALQNHGLIRANPHDHEKT